MNLEREEKVTEENRTELLMENEPCVEAETKETAAIVAANHELQDESKVKSLRERWEAFQQKLSVGQVVTMMVCVLMLLITTSFTIQAFDPVSEPESETEQPTIEDEEPEVILLARVSSTYTPVIPVVEAEIPARTSYETMLNDLKGWVTEFGRINIREESNTDSRVIGHVVFGDQVSMFGTEGDFTRVKYLNQSTGEARYGYCYTAYLSNEQPDTAQIFLDVPLYKQSDSRWGSKMIGGYETLASAGCTTTCISMVETYMTGETIHPDQMADRLLYTYDGLLTFPGRYTRYAGSDYMQVMLNLLHSGVPILVSGYTSDGRTHWVVVVGYNGDGVEMNPADFVINDPGSYRFTLADFFRSYPLFEKIVYYTG